MFGESSVWSAAVSKFSISAVSNIIEFFLYFGLSEFLDVASPINGVGHKNRTAAGPSTVPLVQGVFIHEDLIGFGAASEVGFVANVVEDSVFVEFSSIFSSFGIRRFAFVGHGF